jgi:glutamyl-Q tRNA(Asp) synthetase
MPGWPIYRGRFAPSPTGPLHAGSLVAALGSWLDARAHQGQWLLRMEDVDTPRCRPEWAQLIEWQLHALGLHSDEPVLYQSSRSSAYAAALTQLQQASLAYACTCSRSQIAQTLASSGQQRARFADLVYPGTCRPQFAPSDDKAANAVIKPIDQHVIVPNPPPHKAHGSNQGDKATQIVRFNRELAPPQRAAWRFALPSNLPECIHWQDRRLGAQSQDLRKEVGDFVLRRADGLWAYQLAVVVDDAAQSVTHVVRGEDMADNTARQIALQQALGLATPQYLHLPLVLAADGHKLSKQNGAQALDLSSEAAVMHELNIAAQALGLPMSETPDRHSSLQHWALLWPLIFR